MPSLSIVTPSLNHAQFIERTLRSVLDQSIDDLEYVVCDGGSTDGTIDILRRYEGTLRWVSEPDGGQSDAINKGISMTKGEIVGWLSSDDIYYPDALNQICAYFDAHPEVDAIYGDATHIDAHDGVIEPYYTENWNYERLKDVCFLCQPAVFLRRRIVEQFGLLDPTLRYCMDYEYWLRIGATTPFVRVPYTLAGSRLHEATKTIGSRVAVHAEINNMLQRTLGGVSTRWLYNYAFAVYDSRGWQRRDLHRHVWILSRALTTAYLRWRRAIPLSAFRTLGGWFWDSWRAAGQAEVGQ